MSNNSDMIKLVKLFESQQKFAGEEVGQKPGDQVRGTDKAVARGKDHPFKGRLVGEDKTLEDVIAKKYQDFKDVQAKEKEKKKEKEELDEVAGETPEKEIERLKLRQNAWKKAPLRDQAATQARIRELEKQIKDKKGVAEGSTAPISKGRRAGKAGHPLAPPYPKGSKEYSEFEKGWNEKEDIRKANKLAPYDKKGVAEGYDKWGWHTSLTNGEFMPTKYGNKAYVYLHDLDNKSPRGGPQLVTVNKPAVAKQIAQQFGGKVVKTDLNTYRIVKPAEQDVDESMGKLAGLTALGIGAGLAGNYMDQQQPKVEVGGQQAFLIKNPGWGKVPDTAMILKGKDGKTYKVWSPSRNNRTLYATPVEGIKEQGVAEGGITKYSNPTDTVSMDVPFLIRALEFAREDAKNDMELHSAVERMLDAAKTGKPLDMNDYTMVFGDKQVNEISANPEYLRAAERSLSTARDTQRQYWRSPEEKAAARRTELKREKGMAGYSKRHRAANPEMYPKVTPRPAPKLRDPSTEYSDDYSVWAAGRRDTVDEGFGDDNPVVNAITRRILMQRSDLLTKYGVSRVSDAIDEVADFVGDVDEIGTSDVSGWVRHVEQLLGNMGGDVDEAAPALVRGAAGLAMGALSGTGGGILGSTLGPVLGAAFAAYAGYSGAKLGMQTADDIWDWATKKFGGEQQAETFVMAHARAAAKGEPEFTFGGTTFKTTLQPEQAKSAVQAVKSVAETREQNLSELGATPPPPPQGTATTRAPTTTANAAATSGSVSPDEQTALNKISQTPAMKQQLDKLMTQATPGAASAPMKLDQEQQDALNRIKANAGLGSQYAKLIAQANPAAAAKTATKP